MSITNVVTQQTYAGTGAQILFSIPFQYQLITEIVVYVNDVQKIVSVDYTLTDSGGNPSVTPSHIRFGTAPANGAVVKIERITEATQTVSLLSTSSIILLNAMTDKLTQLVQELRTKVGLIPTGADIDDIDDRLDDLESDVSALQLSVSGINSTISSINSSISSINSSLSALSGIDAGLQSQIDIISNDVGTLQNDMNQAQSDINSAEADIITLQSRVSTLENSIGIVGEQSISNNTTGNITILNLNNTFYDAYIVDFIMFRKTDTDKKYSSGRLHIVWSSFSNVWKIEKGEEVIDYSGVSFGVSGNQVTYSSSDLAGTNYSGKIKYNLQKFEV